jgi:hypothetical protein
MGEPQGHQFSAKAPLLMIFVELIAFLFSEKFQALFYTLRKIMFDCLS